MGGEVDVVAGQVIDVDGEDEKCDVKEVGARRDGLVGLLVNFIALLSLTQKPRC